MRIKNLTQKIDYDFYLKMVKRKFPWIYEKRKNMIVHSDFDGIMSAMLLHELNDWNVIGFYDLENVWIDKKLFSAISNKELKRKLKSAIWVDVDIYHKEVRSIGHHILKFRIDDRIPEHINSLNSNLLRGIHHSKFHKKYPLGTIHFLMMLLNYKPKENDLTGLLLWHPDSTLANAQHYKENVKDWLYNFLNIDLMIKTFQKVQTVEFEKEINEKIYSTLQKMGFQPGRGQIGTIHLHLRGYQCSFGNPTNHIISINKLIDFIGKIMGWKKMKIPYSYICVQGIRKNITYKDIREKFSTFDTFLKKEKVFSYSIPNRNRVNYTIIPQLK